MHDNIGNSDSKFADVSKSDECKETKPIISDFKNLIQDQQKVIE